MGVTSIQGMMEMVEVDTALQWHLQHNHYPALPDYVFNLAKKAIKKANSGKWDDKISLKGTGITWRGLKSVPVYACIQGWHIEEFLKDDVH